MQQYNRFHPASDYRYVRKTVTLDGSTSYNLFEVTGVVECTVIGYCTTDCKAHTDTLSVGVTGSTALFIAATASQDIDANEVWTDASPSTYSETLPAKKLISGLTIKLTGTSNIDAGVIEFICLWRPMSSSGSAVEAA